MAVKEFSTLIEYAKQLIEDLDTSMVVVVLETDKGVVYSEKCKVSEEYTYTFIGWDKEITAALCDVTYYAVFDVVEVVQPEPSPTIKTLDTIITVGAILLVPLVAIIIIFAKKKRREFIKTKISQIFKKLSRKSTKN